MFYKAALGLILEKKYRNRKWDRFTVWLHGGTNKSCGTWSVVRSASQTPPQRLQLSKASGHKNWWFAFGEMLPTIPEQRCDTLMWKHVPSSCPQTRSGACRRPPLSSVSERPVSEWQQTRKNTSGLRMNHACGDGRADLWPDEVIFRPSYRARLELLQHVASRLRLRAFIWFQEPDDVPNGINTQVLCCHFLLVQGLHWHEN